ncbi:MAG: hypothetical protein U9R58_01115 [Chloroflexota bacterium]|nr:hypothetical protein [Chloroflexota bacterium]
MNGKIRLKVTAGKLASRDGSRRTYAARFARAGRVRTAGDRESDVMLESQALSSAWQDGLFDARSVFVDHAALWEYPSLQNLVGVTQKSSWNEMAGTIGGEIVLYDTPLADTIAMLLDQLLEEESPPDVGLSMVFYPVWEQQNPGDSQPAGVQTRRIIGISHIESIDLVFEPAADGRILHALSTHHHPPTALLDSPPPTVGQDSIPPTVGQVSIPATFGWDSIPAAPHPSPTQSPIIKRASERTSPKGKKQMTQDSTLPNSENEQAPETTIAPDPAAESNPEQPILSDSAADWMSSLEHSAVHAMILNSGLPGASSEHLLSRTYSTSEDVRQAIEAERQYLARLQEDSVIQIGSNPPRQPGISGMRTSLDQIQIALEALLEGVRPEGGIQPLTGIRELYMLLSGDYEMTGVFHSDRIQFANVTTSTMANMTADALNKRVMAEFQAYPQWWQPIVNIEDFATLQDVKWIVLGGVGELPTVSEGAAYTELTWDDQKETSSFVKKGGYLGITIEAIDKDDTGRLRAAPRALAQAAWLTLAKAVSEIFTANSGVGPTLSDSLALFHSTHGNLGTSALSVSTWSAARVAMRKMTEVNSGERLGALTAPRHLLVPPDLELTALQVLASEYDYTYALSNGTAAPANVFTEGDGLSARMQFARSRVIVVDLWSDTNNWAAAADPRLYPTIGLGFRYGRVPEVFSVASPTAGLMFTNDTMPIKVRFFFATGPVDYRGLYKANVS